MSLRNIEPDRRTWSLLQNISHEELNKKRGSRLSEIQGRRDALSIEAAEHILINKLIPRGEKF